MNLFALHATPEQLAKYKDMLKVPELAYEYAKNKGVPVPEAEPAIMKNPRRAYWYALHILGRQQWPEAEPYIMKDPTWAMWYALSILGRRWPEAEPYIMQDPMHWETFTLKSLESIKRRSNMKRTIEIRAAEGGEDSRLFTKDLADAYIKMALRLG